MDAPSPRRQKAFLSPEPKTPATMGKWIASYRLCSLINPAGKTNFEKPTVWESRKRNFTLRLIGVTGFCAEITTGENI